MRVVVYSDADLLARGAAELIAAALRRSPGPRVTFGLAGGSTPRATYEALRSVEIDWGRVHAWLADERWVPSDHPESNAAMAKDALFERVPATLHPVPWDPDRSPRAGAAAYEQLLREILADADGRLRPDLVLLGLGDDGHTASLFPDTSALDERRHLYVANWVGAVGGWRVTATLPLLHTARKIIFLAAGAAKADVVQRVLEDPADENLPARRVAGGAAEVVWLLDDSAGSALRATEIERP